MGFLKGKKILVTGIMSNRSIAFGIAKAIHREGGKMVFTYVNKKFKDRISKLVKIFNPVSILPCDVSSDNQINNLFDMLKEYWENFDGIIHSIAFAPMDQLEGDFLSNITREGFLTAHEISSYSLCAIAKSAKNMMKKSPSSIVALTYLGSQKTVVNYNTMGLAKASLESSIRYISQSLGPDNIRINAISSGPIRTLAASGISGFRKILDYNAKISPLRRNVTIEEIGNIAAFLSSDLSSAITGEIIYADCGFNTIGVANL